MGKVLSVTTAAKAWEWIDKAIDVMRRDGQHRYSTYRFRAALQDVEAPFGSEAIPRRCGISTQDIADRFGAGHVAQTVELGPGVTADAPLAHNWEDSWARLTEAYLRRKIANSREINRSVTIQAKGPICVLVLGDMHIGSASVDYPRLLWVAEQLQKPNVYGVFVGDVVDAMIWPKVRYEGRASPLSVHKEVLTAVAWMREAGKIGHMIGGVCGNHDLVSESMAGLSHFLLAMEQGAPRIPIAKNELLLSVTVGDAKRSETYAWEIRHHFPGNSIYNSAHGATRWHLFNSRDSEIACGGHTHQSGVVPMVLHGKKRVGIQVGAFKDPEPDEYRAASGFSMVSGNEREYGVILHRDSHTFEVMSAERGIEAVESDRRASDGRGRGSATSRVRDAAPVHARRKTNRRLRRA